MFVNMENLKVMSALYGISAINKHFLSRPYHALVFKIDGQSVYTFGEEIITLSQGQVLFIPQGSTYTVSRLSSEESHYALINFSATLPNCQPTLFPCGSFHDFRYIIDRLIKVLLFDSPSGTFESLSLFYRVIAELYQHKRNAYSDPDKKQLIEAATSYLEDHIFDCDLKVTLLHTMCGISDTYFRRIFIAEYGVSPKKYILQKRLTQAKNILNGGDYTYVYEVAAAVGFDDPLYFSKVFKSFFGYFPSET